MSNEFLKQPKLLEDKFNDPFWSKKVVCRYGVGLGSLAKTSLPTTDKCNEDSKRCDAVTGEINMLANTDLLGTRRSYNKD